MYNMAKPSLDYNSIEELPEHFWDKVNKTDSCWLWTGKIDDGYGRFNIKGTTLFSTSPNYVCIKRKDCRRTSCRPPLYGKKLL